MASKEKKAAETSSTKDELIRRFKANPGIFIGTVVILVIVIVSFIVVPAMVPEAQRGEDRIFGYYNKIPIKYVANGYFATVRRNIAERRQAEANQAGNYNNIHSQIWQQAYTETVIRTAILDEMKRAGYTAPSKLVDKGVALLPDFQENGRFSAARYQRMDSSARLNLWQQVRDDIAAQKYLSDLKFIGFSYNDNGEPGISEQEASFIAAMSTPERSFDMAVFPIDAYPEPEIRSFAVANPDPFRITRLSKISVNSSEREARQVLTSIKDGTTTFEEAARTQSQDGYAEKGGDMGLKAVWELSGEVSEEVDYGILGALPRGEFSDILKTSKGWAFFRAEEAPRTADLDDPAIMEKVKAYFREFERGRMEDWASGEARAFSARVRETSFDEAVDEREITKRHFGPLPVNYGELELFTPISSFSIPELSGGEKNDNFWQIAFSTPLNSPSEPLVLGRNVLVLFPLEETENENLEFIKSYTSYWISTLNERSVRNYFLTSDKFEDHFFPAYFKYFLANEG
jgi:hypothetical protein